MYKWLFLLALPLFAQTPVEPSQLFSVGSGVSGLGPSQLFGYYSISQHIAQGTYTTEINEFARLKGGTVGTCARAGVSKVMWQFGSTIIGVVGDAGACETAVGSAGGAVSARCFLSYKFPKNSWHFIVTAETLKTAGGTNQPTVTMGIGYGVYK